MPTTIIYSYTPTLPLNTPFVPTHISRLKPPAQAQPPRRRSRSRTRSAQCASLVPSLAFVANAQMGIIAHMPIWILFVGFFTSGAIPCSVALCERMWQLQLLGQVLGSRPATSALTWSCPIALDPDQTIMVISEMDATGGQSLYPLHRCKTLHLVRHAQGVHNVEGEKDHDAYLSYDLFDAQLTPLGWKQVDNLRTHVQASGLSKRIDLVVVSPLLRTMQTAVGVFGGEAYTDGVNVPPLMVAKTGNSDHPAISSLNCPPFLAVELCREHHGVHPCDKRRSIREYRSLFPAIDFSLIESDDDILWKPDIREKNEEVAARGMKFLKWLWTREEKEIAIVTHSGFLFHTLGTFGNDCHPSVKSEICTNFANCELRSVVIIDRSMNASASSTTNYPGKIPHGLDLPSD